MSEKDLGKKGNPNLFIALNIDTDSFRSFFFASQLRQNLGVTNLGFYLPPNRVNSWGTEQLLTFSEYVGGPLFVEVSRSMDPSCDISLAKEYALKGATHLGVSSLMGENIQKLQKEIDSNAKVVALTILSQEGDAACLSIYGKSFGDAVVHFTELAIKNGCRDIIVPATGLKFIENIGVEKYVPGIRTLDYDSPDGHIHLSSPLKAIKDGADNLIIGRPITNYWQDISMATKKAYDILNQIAKAS